MPELEYRPYGKLPWYPHMGPVDAAIWERYIEKHPDAFSSVAYDVAVGEGTSMNTIVNTATGGDVNRLYQRRIDAIGITPRMLYVVEVKPRASTSSLGQVKGYVKLFQRDFAPVLPVQPLIVTDELMPEMHFLSSDEGVELEVV